MNPGNAKALYLAWVRTHYPMSYVNALRKITSKPRSLGGLGDDLTDSFSSPDIQAVVGDTQLSADVQATLDNIPPQNSPDWFTSFTNAVSNVASTYLQTSAQSNLLAVNTQRARQGLPPLAANGAPVTASMLAPANASVYAMEQKLAGAASSPGLMLGIGLAIVGVLMFARGGSSPRRRR